VGWLPFFTRVRDQDLITALLTGGRGGGRVKDLLPQGTAPLFRIAGPGFLHGPWPILQQVKIMVPGGLLPPLGYEPKMISDGNYLR